MMSSSSGGSGRAGSVNGAIASARSAAQQRYRRQQQQQQQGDVVHDANAAGGNDIPQDDDGSVEVVEDAGNANDDGGGQLGGGGGGDAAAAAAASNVAESSAPRPKAKAPKKRQTKKKQTAKAVDFMTEQIPAEPRMAPVTEPPAMMQLWDQRKNAGPFLQKLGAAKQNEKNVERLIEYKPHLHRVQEEYKRAHKGFGKVVNEVGEYQHDVHQYASTMQGMVDGLRDIVRGQEVELTKERCNNQLLQSRIDLLEQAQKVTESQHENTVSVMKENLKSAQGTINHLQSTELVKTRGKCSVDASRQKEIDKYELKTSKQERENAKAQKDVQDVYSMHTRQNGPSSQHVT